MKKMLGMLIVVTLFPGAAALRADVSLGIWLSDVSDYPTFEDAAGKQHAIIQYALLWDATASSHTTQLNKIDSYDAVPMCLWGRGNEYSASKGHSYASIAGGGADETIRAVAEKVKEFDKPVIFTIDMEFNHKDNPSCYVNDPSGNPSGFGEMWRHIVDVFDNKGATKVQWAWIPNYQGVPNDATNNYHNYYPGDAYVDWVGALGFDADWGAGSGSAGLSFTSLFGGILGDFNCSYPTKPQIIGWFGTAASGSAKGSWVQDAYGAMSSSPNLRAACYHNATGGSFDYRIWGSGISSSVTNAYAAAISPAFFLSNLPADITPDGSACSGTNIDLTPNKYVFSTTDYIRITANVKPMSTPFYPYVRIIFPSGTPLYYVRNSGFTTVPTPYLGGGPFTTVNYIAGYEVLATNYSITQTGNFTLEGYATASSSATIGEVDRETLVVN